VFNLHNVGLGNNGGSRTLIRSAETLQELGVDTCFYSNTPNNYTWHRFDVPVIRKPIKCDVIVATGYGSVAETLRYKCDKKFYYIRGFELWQASVNRLLKSYRSLKCIVNSEWLQKILLNNHIKSELIYPGLDFDDMSNDINDSRTLGGLYHSRHTTKRHTDIIAVAKHLGCKCLLLNRDLQNGSPQQVRDFYHTTGVWMAPTELEGLHNPPMEACLHGNVLVRTDHAKCGMEDYSNTSNSLIYRARDIVGAAECVKQLLDDVVLRKKLRAAMVTVLQHKIGTRQKNMTRLIDIFQK
jgi:hypothetical protein